MKEGKNWEACYDATHDRYLACLIFTSREGQERSTYELTEEAYDALSESAERAKVAELAEEGRKKNRELIESGRLMAHFENTMYGTQGPELTNYDPEGEKAFDRAILRVKAEKGNGEAQFKLGKLYEDGKGVEQSDEEAFRWYTKAVKSGCSAALYDLGCFYFSGRGGAEMSRERAISLWKQAAEHGNVAAKNQLLSLKKKKR